MRRACATCCPHFDLSQPTISHHLKVLHEAGLLHREKRGTWVFYLARPEAMAALGSLFTAAPSQRPGRRERMSDTVNETATGTPTDPVLQRLSTLDRFLPVWIGVAMVSGLLLGRLVDGLDDALAAVEVGSVSLPIAIGLLIMMYPVLPRSAKTSSVTSLATPGCSSRPSCSTGCSGRR